ncbi:DedA family protein [Herbidospora mongoliensis]|uniref:DedA family protein n=1 Tax=Herbidospora mongoliensis TaxID=688067 RepID=UPI0008316F0C|nr:DedA family protein [Herbidospora mongoliensis]
MTDAIMTFLHDVMTSPWVYAALLAISVIDAFFPVVPSETAVITAGVFAAAEGTPHLGLVIAAAATGAFIGDNISYQIGRAGGARIRHRTAIRWAHAAFEERGGLLLVVARYIPGGRTAVTLTTGVVRYPLHRFAFFDGIAVISWAAYSALIGYIGGAAFEDNPFKGLLLGLGIALTVTAIVEIVRYVSRRRSQPAGPDRDDPAGHPRELTNSDS